jgi:transposase InsO family protein
VAWPFVAFMIDVFARRIVGWHASTLLNTELVLDALEQALDDRADRGCRYLPIDHGVLLAECGIRPSVGYSADSDVNALAESIIGLYKYHPEVTASIHTDFATLLCRRARSGRITLNLRPFRN